MAYDTGLADRLRREGLRVVEVAGWKTRGSSSPRPNLILYTDGLLSKWGFSDGDVVGDWYLDTSDRWSSIGLARDREILVALVKKYVLPALDQEVEVQVIPLTLHNPIRAVKIDGVHVSRENVTDLSLSLTPKTVEVSEGQFWEVVRELEDLPQQ